MKRIIAGSVAAVLFGVSAWAIEAPRDTVFQYSIFNALLSGVYEGEMNYGKLRQHGDFGIGTFNDMDGEMVAVDGTFYQARADGSVIPAKDDMLTPFAMVTFFEASDSHILPAETDYKAFPAWLDKQLPDLNHVYAVKVSGTFKHLVLRSPHKLSKPYPPITQVIKDQAVFDLKGVEGTMVGFRSPAFANSINVPGYHLHFISTDRKHAGHVLAFTADSAKVELDRGKTLTVEFPDNAAFNKGELAGDKSAELNAVTKKAGQ